MSVERDESVVRALHLPFWNDELKRGTKSAFQQSRVSLSRERLLSYTEIVEIFKADLDRPEKEGVPGRSVQGTATVNVGQVLKLCAAAESARQVEFVADPVPAGPSRRENPSHAEMRVSNEKGVPKKLSDAVAQDILNVAIFRSC